MKRVLVATNLILDEEMYELAKARLGEIAPAEVPMFTWEWFITRENWTLIPDIEHPEIPWFKAELIIKSGPPYLQTIKLNVWFAGELLRSGQPMPHSHPWRFDSDVLLGGYEEDRYITSNQQLLDDPHSPCDLSGFTLESDIRHEARTVNTLPLHVFHEVKRVLVPGRTLSIMNCDLGRKEGWGYLNLRSELYVPVEDSDRGTLFKELVLDRNPHLRRKKK